MRRKQLTAVLAAVMSAALVAGCGPNGDMQQITETYQGAVVRGVLEGLEASGLFGIGGVTYDIIDAERGADMKVANTAYYDGMSQMDLDYRVGKKGATKEELIALARDQVMDMTPEDVEYLDACVAKVSNRFNELGFLFPATETISFIKTGTADESGAGAYTHGDEIYLSDSFFELLKSGEPKKVLYCDQTMAHELFHVLTRNHPEFKENMYRLIGFTVDEKEPAFTEEVRAQICSNPDVESYNNHGTFIVKGEPVEATIVTVFDGEYQSGEVMLEHVVPALVPIDSPDHIIPLEDVDNFYEVVGSNTKYVIAAEECLADNFSFAIANGLDEDYATPAIPAAMIDYLSTGEETVPVTGETAAEAAEEVIEEAEEIEAEVKAEEAEAEAAEAEVEAVEAEAEAVEAEAEAAEAEAEKAAAEGDKSVDEIAHEIIRGLWGDGIDRVEALEEAGYDPVAVQERVNELMM